MFVCLRDEVNVAAAVNIIITIIVYIWSFTQFYHLCDDQFYFLMIALNCMTELTGFIS